MKLYSLNTKLDFGDFKGQTLKDVFMKDPDYIETCILENPVFCFTDNILEKLEDMHDEFAFSDEAVETRFMRKKKISLMKVKTSMPKT